MPHTTAHPPVAVLEAFALGKLDDPGSAEVEEHLASCEHCLARAAAVPPDTLVEAVAAARTVGDPPRADAPTATFAGATTRDWDGTAHAPDETAPPAALAGHPKYRVIRRLGTGGMGTVWLAEHAVMHRPVAVKVIRPDLLARPAARFLREVRAAAKLDHPNILRAYDAEPVGDSCLLAMEYVEGETLADRVSRCGPLPAAEACRAARDAARGLAHAHAAGLVHRDVKPHNLIRAADGTVKVLDFGLAGVVAGEGIAAASDGLTGAGMVAGTPDYIAPEQAADPHAADARADVYGLGCTLYHLLAGRLPFPDGSVVEKLDAHRSRTADPIPGLPAGLTAVLAKMMAKRPEDRFRTAAEVAAALEPFIGETRPKPRHRWPAIAAGLLFVFTAVAAGVVFKIQRDNQEITIETDDPDIEVVMKRKGEVVRVIDRKSGQAWDIDTAANQIGLADTPDGLRFELPENGSVVMKRRGDKDGKPVFTVARLPAPPAAKSDYERIQGMWRASGEYDADTPFTPEEVKQLTMTFAGDTVTLTQPGGRRQTGTFTLDQTRDPKHLTIKGSEADNVRGNFGIYSLDGDTLRICMGGALMERPTEFKSRIGDKRYVNVVLRREASKPDKELILGTWVGVSAEVDGQPMPPEAMDAIKPTLTFTPEKLTARPGAVPPKDYFDAAAKQGLLPKDAVTLLEKGIEGVYHLDPTKPPKTIDITILGDNVRRSALGLYALDGDTLKLCLSLNPEKVAERPAEFSSRAGTMRVLVTFKRQAPEKVGLIHDLPWPGAKDANVDTAAVSPDGRYVLAASESPEVLTAVWDRGTGKLVSTFPAFPGSVFLPDGKTVLAPSRVGRDMRIAVWDMTTGKEVRRFPFNVAWLRLSVSADGTRAVSCPQHGIDAPLVVWDVAAAKVVSEWQPGHDGGFTAAISPNGKRVVTVGRKDRTVKLWDTAEKKEIRSWVSRDREMYGTIAFEPNGWLFVVATQSGVAGFSEGGGDFHWAWSNGVETSGAVAPGGRLALLYDDTGAVRAYDLTSGPAPGSVPLPGRLKGWMGLSADGRFGAAVARTDGPPRVFVFRLPAPPIPQRNPK